MRLASPRPSTRPPALKRARRRRGRRGNVRGNSEETRTGQGASAVTRARLRQNRARSVGGRTSVSWLSEAERSRWKALAASRPRRREGDRQRAPVARDGGPGDRGRRRSARSRQPGERRLLDAEQGWPARTCPAGRRPARTAAWPARSGSPWRSATRAKADWVRTDSRISPSASGCSPPAVTGSTPTRSALKMFVMLIVSRCELA